MEGKIYSPVGNLAERVNQEQINTANGIMHILLFTLAAINFHSDTFTGHTAADPGFGEERFVPIPFPSP